MPSWVRKMAVASGRFADDEDERVAMNERAEAVRGTVERAAAVLASADESRRVCRSIQADQQGRAALEGDSLGQRKLLTASAVAGESLRHVAG